MAENFRKDEFLLKCLQGKADEQEYEFAYKWINCDKSNLSYYEEIRDSWIAAGIVTRNNEHNCNKAWRRVARRTGVQYFNTPRINVGWKNIAAVFLVAFTLGAFCYQHFYSQNEVFPEREYLVKVPLGAQTHLLLPDSTEVWLNAGSTLRYSTHYDVTGRSVYLSGEAYFAVESGRMHTFKVHVSDLIISAMGTEFNVKAYPEENVIETTLVSGLISLEHTAPYKGTEKILLKPRQSVFLTYGKTKIDVFDAADEITKEVDQKIIMDSIRPLKEIIVKNRINTSVYTSWREKRFIFERERMADLAVKLERIYDVQITFEDEDLKAYYISGSLEQETIEQLLEAIRLTIPLDFTIKQNNVVLTINQQLKERYNKFSD